MVRKVFVHENWIGAASEDDSPDGILVGCPAENDFSVFRMLTIPPALEEDSQVGDGDEPWESRFAAGVEDALPGGLAVIGVVSIGRSGKRGMDLLELAQTICKVPEIIVMTKQSTGSSKVKCSLVTPQEMRSEAQWEGLSFEVQDGLLDSYRVEQASASLQIYAEDADALSRMLSDGVYSDQPVRLIEPGLVPTTSPKVAKLLLPVQYSSSDMSSEVLGAESTYQIDGAVRLLAVVKANSANSDIEATFKQDLGRTVRNRVNSTMDGADLKPGRIRLPPRAVMWIYPVLPVSESLWPDTTVEDVRENLLELFGNVDVPDVEIIEPQKISVARGKARSVTSQSSTSLMSRETWKASRSSELPLTGIAISLVILIIAMIIAMLVMAAGNQKS